MPQEEHPGAIYFKAGGAKKFKSDSSVAFARRKNEDLLALDDGLQKFEKIPAEDHGARIAALLVMLTRANHWIDDKTKHKIQHDTSHRFIHVVKLRDAAEAELKREKARANWGKLRGAVGKLFPKGSAQRRDPNATDPLKYMEVQADYQAGVVTINNWLEILDKEHRRGQELTKHFRTWVNSTETCSFWDYLEKLDKPALDELAKYKVSYLDDPFYRALFEVTIENGRMYSRMSSQAQGFIMARRPRETVLKWVDYKPLDTTKWSCAALRGFTDGWGAFVLSPQEVIYAGLHIGGTFHHSSFLAGAPVLAAGMIRVENGLIRGIHEKNGHYQSQSLHMKTFLRILRAKMPGVDWFKVPYHEFNGWETTVGDFLGLPKPPPRPARSAPHPPVQPQPTVQQTGPISVQQRIRQFEGTT